MIVHCTYLYSFSSIGIDRGLSGSKIQDDVRANFGLMVLNGTKTIGINIIYETYFFRFFFLIECTFLYSLRIC